MSGIVQKFSSQNGEGRKRKNEEGSDGTAGGRRKKAKFQGYKEDPFVYFDADAPDAAFTEIKEYFGIEVGGPRNYSG